MSGRVAVILFNLGGPAGRETVKPFLYRFFSDPNIIALPPPLRQMLAALIARRRSRREAESSYRHLNWQSPLLANSQAQAVALEAALNAGGQGNYKVFVCMRYWKPLATEVARQVKAWQPERIVLLPLYPQYSTTTTRSSFQNWRRASRKAGLKTPTSAICCYPLNEGFIKASEANIAPVYRKAIEQSRLHNLKPPRLLFSAHGLPEKIVKGGDPYQWQCEESARAIVNALGIPKLDWQICYQSKVGRLRWIGPSTVEALENAAIDRIPVVIYPHAFVSEHVETLVELDIECRHMADRIGIPYLARVGTVGASPLFIDGLKDMVLRHIDRADIAPDTGPRLCPAGRSRCCLSDPTARL